MNVSTHKYELILIGILILSAALNFYQLDAHDTWMDEEYTFRYAYQDFPELLSSLKEDNHSPLYYQLVGFMIGDSQSKFLLRFPSALCGVLSTIGVFLLAAELFDKKRGVIASFMFSISAYMILYAQNARMYALFICAALFTVLFFIRYLKNKNKRDGMLFAVAGGIMMYAHYLGFFILGILFVVLLIQFRGSIKEFLKQSSFFYLIFLLFMPWIPMVRQQMAGTGKTLAWIEHVDYTAVFAYFFTPFHLSGVSYLVLGASILLIAYSIKKHKEKDKKVQTVMGASFLVAWFVVLPLLLYLIGWFHQRYFVVFCPFLLIFIADAIADHKKLLYIYVFIFSVVNAFSLYFWYIVSPGIFRWELLTPLL